MCSSGDNLYFYQEGSVKIRGSAIKDFCRVIRAYSTNACTSLTIEVPEQGTRYVLN